MKRGIFIFFSLLLAFGSYADSKDSLRLLIDSKTTHDTTRINALNKLAYLYRRIAPDTAIVYANHAMELAEKKEYKKGIADALQMSGMVYNNMGEYQKALNLFYRSLALRKEIKDEHGKGVLYHNIGLSFYNKGNMEKALKYYILSANVDEKAGDKMGEAITLNNIGLIYWGQSQFDKALYYFTISKKGHEEAKNYSGVAGALSNIGGVYYYKGDKYRAKQTFIDALKMYELGKDQKGMATVYTNLSEMETESGNYKSAINYLHKALELAKSMQDVYAEFTALSVLGKTYLDINDPQKAKEALLKANELAVKSAATKYIVETNGLLAETEIRLGDLKQAIRHLQTQSTFKDSLLAQQSAKGLAEMEVKFETDKKQKEIELLNKNKALQESEISKQKTFRNSLIGIVVLVIALAVAMFMGYANKKKANSLLAKQKADIELKNEELNQQNEEIAAQRDEIESQRNLMQHKNTEITASIKYAKRLQEAIFPPDELIKQLLPESFILFKPKDIVSGDFYWVDNIENKTYFAAVDCTGHGVPGAFMSLVGFNLLKHAIHEHHRNSPAEILDQVNKDLSISLRQSYHDSAIKDGMDIALCLFDHHTMTLEYAGANNSIYLLQKKNEDPGPFSYELKEIKADKQPVGAFLGEELKPFRNNIIQVNKGDAVYLFSDGFGDQFGGASNKKFKYKQLEDLILSVAFKPMKEQKKIFNDIFENWKGDEEQLDDVLIMGIRI